MKMPRGIARGVYKNNPSHLVGPFVSAFRILSTPPYFLSQSEDTLWLLSRAFRPDPSLEIQ